VIERRFADWRFERHIEGDENQMQYLSPHEERMNFGLTGTFGAKKRENSAKLQPPMFFGRTRLAR
jgi:hypothetical protein